MDNSGEEGHPENDADRPVELAGANGDGSPDSDDKVNNGQRVVSHVIHQADGEDAVVLSDEYVEEGSDAEQFQSMEDEFVPQNLQRASADTGAGNFRATNDAKQDLSPRDRIDGGESAAESVSQSANMTVDPTSDTKPTESESEINTGPLHSPLHSSAPSASQSKESDMQLDSLNTSDSTLESVSCDGSFQSGNSLVLKGDIHGAEALSPRDDVIPADSDRQALEGVGVHVSSEMDNLSDNLHNFDDDDDDDDDDDMQQGKFSDMTRARSPASGNNEGEVGMPGFGEQDGGIEQELPPMQHAPRHPSVQPQTDLTEERVKTSPRRQLSPRSDTDVKVTITNSVQSVFSRDSLDDPAALQHVISAESIVRDADTERSEGNDEDGVCSQSMGQGHLHASPDQRHPEFPFNYNNYKVCRQVEPGVKECLILETGEHVTCRKPPEHKQEYDSHSDSDSSSDQSSVTQSSVNNNSVIQNIETESEALSPNSKSGFKIIHKNKDGAMKFGNLVLSSTKRGADNSVSQSIEPPNRSGSDCSSPRQRGSHSPRSGSESAVIKEMTDTDQPSPRGASESYATREISHTDGRSPRSGSDSSVRREITQRNAVSRSTSESSSARESTSIHDLADLGHVQDIYETESDLRPHLEGGAGTGEDSGAYSSYTRLLPHSADPRYHPYYGEDFQNRSETNFTQTKSPGTSSGFHSRADPKQDEKIDMSALHRAERWLGDRGAPVSPVRQNLSTSVVSSAGSGLIPGFRTLQEQQASWMKMFKMLEEQHQSDLLTQYKQHQRNIHNLQEQIEDDLCRQQDTFQKKLDVHRELLLHNASFAGSYMPPDFLPDGRDAQEDTERSERRTPTLPRPFIRDDDDSIAEKVISGSPLTLDESRTGDILPTPRSKTTRPLLEESYNDSSPRNLSSRAGLRTDLSLSSRVLAGGVYSTPLHLTTSSSRQFSPVIDQVQSTSLRGSDDEDDDPALDYVHVNIPRHSSMLHDDDTSMRSKREHFAADSHLQHVSPPAGEGNTSSNARVSLREKHSKHLTDLRSYYEQELQELRAALSSPEYIKSQSPYKQVMEENLQLQNRLENHEDDINSLRRVNREQDNKIHTFQIRLDDTLEKYEESQVTIATLRHHLDEARVLCKEKEAMIKNLEADNNRLSSALTEAYKMNDQQIAAAKKEEVTMNRLVERHENLHRENESNKEALNQMDGKLYDSRMEIVQLKRTISKLELDNNRINRENNNLRHKGLISSLGLSTFYPMSPQESGLGLSTDCQTPSHNESRIIPGHVSPDVSEIHIDDIFVHDAEFSNGGSDIYKTSPRGRTSSPPPLRDVHRSPLVKAEEDLQNLRRTVKENLGQSLAQQRSLPRSSRVSDRANGVERGGGKSSVRSSLSNSQRSSKSSPSPTKGASPNQLSNGLMQHVENSHATIIDTLMSRVTPQRKLFSTDVDRHLPSGGTPTRFDIDARPVPGSQNSPKKRSSLVKKDKMESKTQRNKKDGVVDTAVQSTLAKMRAGEFVTRPSWENRDTTTVKTAKAQPRPKVKEDKLQERVRTIRELETTYDELQVEKRKLESALSKVPLSGKISHHNRKEKEDLDNQLDKVEKELGSVRMSLKRYHVLKTGH